MPRRGVVAGTPQFMSPEQARGNAVDRRSDLFSLGSVLYAMCTGHSPFRAESTMGVLRRGREVVRIVKADGGPIFKNVGNGIGVPMGDRRTRSTVGGTHSDC